MLILKKPICQVTWQVDPMQTRPKSCVYLSLSFSSCQAVPLSHKLLLKTKLEANSRRRH